MMAGVYNLNDE